MPIDLLEVKRRERKSEGRNRKETESPAGKDMSDSLKEKMKECKRTKKLKCEIYRDSMQNYKKYAIPPAQLIIADVPYNV